MLKNVDLFANLPDQALESLSAYAKRRRYPKNTIILMEGDACNHFYVVETGTLKVFVEDANGRQATLNILGPGEHFGELALIDGAPRSASVMTVTDAELLAISQRDFHTFIEDDHAISLELMKALVKRVRMLTDNVRDLALLDVYGRIKNLLENRVSDDEGLIEPKLTHQEISEMVGASREMVSRIMRELVLGGYIEQTPTSLILRKRFPANW